MAILSIIQRLGFERAVNIRTDKKTLAKSQVEVLEHVEKFGVDEVYFCNDGQNSYPAIFIKRVDQFDNDSLKNIADIQRKVWNYKKVLFLYVYSDTELRIYNCAEKPLIITKDEQDFEKELKQIELESCILTDKKKLQNLNLLFSSMAVDTGIIWTLEEAYELRKKIKLQRRVDKYLVESLIQAAKQLQKEGLNVDVIHKIILRSLFLLYLEDRKATDENFYSQIKKNATSYFNILDDVDATLSLYRKLEQHFNGNVFTVEAGETVSGAQLQIIKRCFISGYDGTPQTELFEDWRLFDFSIIQIELLSEIYENFLAEIEPKKKQQTGTFYTPPSLVELILNEKLPVNNNEKDYNVKILDPSCGSGIFLVGSFKRLVKRYENKNKKRLTDFDILKDLLVNNIYGIEIDSHSIKVAAFSLYLALLDNLNPKTLWQNRQLPYLINDPDEPREKQGKNLYKRDTINENKEIETIEFDLVVGNPPFGTKKLLPSIRDYCDKHGFAKEMVLPFLHKAVKFSSKGDIALILNTKVLTNTGSTYQEFRKWLFNECYVEQVYNFSILRKASKDFGGQLFGSAISPISIVFFKKEIPKLANDRIFYYAPKTFVKSNILEGVVIDSTDIKYLPREECQKPDTKIWKIAMWGGINDLNLLARLSDSNKFFSVKKFASKNKISSGVGFQLLTQKKDKPKFSDYLAKTKYLDAEYITRYYTSDKELKNVISSIKTNKAVTFYKNFYKTSDISNIKTPTAYRRLGDLEAYKPPHMVVKKGLENNSVCASLIEMECSFRDGIYGFYTDKKNEDALKVLMAYFNSKLSSYHLFMTISSYGIEREQIMKNEYLTIPINLNEIETREILMVVNEIIEKKKAESFLKIAEQDTYFDNRIESIITKSLGLTTQEQILINDTITISLDLFHQKEKSKALFPVSNTNTKDYAEMLSAELNNFLEGQNLYSNATTYSIDRFSPLAMVKISFGKKLRKTIQSVEKLSGELQKLDQKLWKKDAVNLYFRKKLNYYDGNDDIYIIRPNQCRFWSQTMAMEDASELILEILNKA